MRYLLPCFLLLLGLSSCGPVFIADEHQPVAPEGWSYEDGKTFSFAVADTQQLYALHLIVEHDADFFAQNFYVEITTTRPDGSQQADQVSLQLADKFGSWYGDCNSEKCELDILIQPVAYFNQQGKYSLKVEQYSRKEMLEGIRGLRFQVEELEERRGK